MTGKNQDNGNRGASIKIGRKLLELLNKIGELELQNVEINAEEMEIWIQPSSSSILQQAPAISAEIALVKPTEILKAEFKPPVQTYSGKIMEVKLGATRSEGGSRGRSLIVGGETSPAFCQFEEVQPNPPVVSVDVFDTEVSLPKSIRTYVQDVIGDPASWAKLAVDKYNADAVTVHLLSTDPLIKNASPRDASKTIEQVLQAVNVPVIVGGCGDPGKDAKVFQKVAEVAEGERVMFSSLTPDMAEAGILSDVCKAAKDNGHVVLAFTALDLNRAKELNRRLYEFLPKESIVMDLTTAALGYGLEYSYSIHERARLAALAGDSELQHPTLSGSTNAWGAREAWMKMGPEWEPRELRGPIWETVTALVLLLAGVDVFMMMHPAAVRTVKEVIKNLMNPAQEKHSEMANWVSIRV
jgi:acetyl-CoA decarbonylase/synthase complex subunit delta